MQIYETTTWKILVNRSHEDCGEYSCDCKSGLPYRMWLKNKRSPINSAWWDFPSEDSAIAKALKWKADMIADYGKRT